MSSHDDESYQGKLTNGVLKELFKIIMWDAI